MKEGIHPEYAPARVTCACGNTFTTRSTHGDMSIDVCAACHPFYTGTQKLIDTAGRVDRFRKRYEKKAVPAPKAKAAPPPAAAAPKPSPEPAPEPAPEAPAGEPPADQS
jgi:large subunit ribosomal protein L31